MSVWRFNVTDQTQLEVFMSQPQSLVDQVEYQSGSIVSKVLLKSSGGTVTLFGFGEGEGLSEHTAPFDALILVVEGAAEVTVADGRCRVETGEVLQLPANVPHSVSATTDFKMLLIMLRERQDS